MLKPILKTVAVIIICATVVAAVISVVALLNGKTFLEQLQILFS